MSDGVDPEEVEREVMFLLTGIREAGELEKLCTVVPLTLPEEIRGKTKSILKFLLRHLNSEDVENSSDGGLATFLKLYECLTERKTDAKTKKTEENEPLLSAETHGQVRPLFDVQKLKDFKISGIIGGGEKKDGLSYSSLSYQISNGLKQGYPEELICAAVLRAISPGNNLRTYLESKRNLDVTSLLEVMRSHFHEKDSSSIFTELSNAVQDVNESCLEFVIRTMCLRQKIISLGNEEGCPYDENLVQKRFLHTIETGLRNNNIRSDLRDSTLKKKFPDDGEFVLHVEKE